MADGNDVLVVVETEEGKPNGLAHEMLGLARRLADDAGGSVAAVLFGDGVADASADLIAHGADKVFVADGAVFATYQAEAWMPDLVNIANDVDPAAILVGHSMLGADLAPRLAFRLQTAIATGCEEMVADGDKLLMTRACFGGNAREVVSFNTTPAVATIKAKSQEALDADSGRTGEVVVVQSCLDDSAMRARVTGREREKTTGVRLENADVVIAGGRGTGGPEGFDILRELAGLMGGAVGASRVACDLGWCPPSYQVGLTGRTVAPEIYIAVGISGAGQHMAGCARSKAIVAINSDADAAIFAKSRFGAVGDCTQIMPAFLEEVRKLKG